MYTTRIVFPYRDHDDDDVVDDDDDNYTSLAYQMKI